ncbi:MAG: universal stress protein [Melioribacteraceae bacterium]
MLFSRLGIAFTFSPNALRLLKIAHRLQKLFQSELIIIHAGEDSKEIREKIFTMIKEANLPDHSYEIIIREGETSKTISKICEEKNIDLLISGALEKESLLKYYLGSVARRLMHELPCSLLVIVNPENISDSFQRFCVNVDYSPQNEAAVKKAYEFAKLENAKEFILVREFQIPGLAITIYDGGETDRAEKTRLEIQKEEEEKLKIFSDELNLTGLEVKRVCLYGKQGWELKQYATDSKSDLLVISSPPKKLKLFDKIFQHDIEFILNQLPCSLLIIRS